MYSVSASPAYPPASTGLFAFPRKYEELCYACSIVVARAVDADATACICYSYDNNLAALHSERERDNMSNILCHTDTHTDTHRWKGTGRGTHILTHILGIVSQIPARLFSFPCGNV